MEMFKSAKKIVDEMVENFKPFVNEKVIDNYYERVEYMNCEKEKIKNANNCALILVNYLLKDIEADIDASQGGVSYHQNLVDLGMWREIKNEIENRIKNNL